MIFNSSFIYGIVFLFRWSSQNHENVDFLLSNDQALSEIFYAKQLAQNSCATHALLHILFNRSCELNHELVRHKQSMKSLSSNEKGNYISNEDYFFGIHRFFANPTRSIEAKIENGEAFHYSSFIPFKEKKFLELDGLKSGPVLYNCDKGNNWFVSSLNTIKSKIDSTKILSKSNSEIKFHVMVILKNRNIILKQLLNELSLGDIQKEYTDLIELENAKRRKAEALKSCYQGNFRPLLKSINYEKFPSFTNS